MDDSAPAGLSHVARGGALVPGSRRANLIARSRREVAGSAANPHYSEAVAYYSAERFREAVGSFRLAAEQGHAESQYLLSTMLDEGLGTPQNTVEAAQWEMSAAEQGHVYAQANVSFRCYAADDFAGAFLWCRRAADRGLAWAQYNLGLMYRKGEGVEQNDTEAARFYRLAADQQHPEAQSKLAELYSLGQGVPRSDASAASWYRKAADADDAEAQYQLGHMYAVGQGVEHDYVQSRYWIRKASLQGHTAAVRELKSREYRDA